LPNTKGYFMRTRSMGSLEDAYEVIKDYSTTGALQTTSSFSSSSKANGSYQTTSDVVTERFESRRANGEVFMNPFSISKTRRETSRSFFTFGPHPVWGKRTIEGTVACMWSVPPSRPAWFNTRISDAKQRTLAEALAKVASTEVLSLVSVAEAGKTARQLSKPFNAALTLIDKIATKKMSLVAKGVSATSAATSAWLEYRFGWKPLLYDIQGIHDSWLQNEQFHSKPVRLVARASDSNIIWDSVQNVSSSVPTGTSGAKMVANYSHRAKVSSGVLYELYDESLASATARRMGTRLSDVPSTIWELVPFSFVVDRFLDVGTWLNAIVPKPGVRSLGRWTTTIDYQLNFHRIMDVWVSVANAPATVYHNSGGTYSEEIQSIDRVVDPIYVPVPTVNYRDLNLSQEIDHIALIYANLKNLAVRS
jgi:hypothetical protein